MLSYVIKRLVYMMPTVLFVLLFSFVLMTLSPGDEISTRLELSGATNHFNSHSYLDDYKELSHELGYDLPQFYIGFRPSYFPDTIQRIIPKGRRSLLTSCLRQTRDWEGVTHINNLLSIVSSELEGSKGIERSVHIEVVKMTQAKDLSDLKSYSRKVRSLLSDIEPSINTGRLLTSIDNLERLKVFVYPKFSWNGSSNQFHKWAKRLLHQSHNISLVDGAPSFSKISRALKWTVSLSLVVLLLTVIVSLLIGYAQARFEETWFDKIFSSFLYILMAIPTFWLASLLVVFFTTPEYGAWTDIFPSIGLKPSFVERSFFEEFVNNAEQLILPIFCLTLLSISYLSFQLKSDLLDAMTRPYTLMAKAKGLSTSQIFKSHAFPNALLPFVTIVSGALPKIFTGSVIIEVIFNIPGIGRLLLFSLRQSDWPVVFSIVIVISIATIIGYLLGDILLMKLYPKSSSGLSSSNVVGR